jgi:carbon storage regulator CsrA
MLVLTRKLQEKITIAGNITVTVLRVKGQTVRIGIEAPRDIRVVRGELPLEVAKELMGEASEPAAALSSGDEGEDAASVSTKLPSKAQNGSRLPQRRKFDRYAQAPLKGAVMSAVLAK